MNLTTEDGRFALVVRRFPPRPETAVPEFVEAIETVTAEVADRVRRLPG
ncbi:hypothetical protein [Mycobacterium sp. Lab-001]